MTWIIVSILIAVTSLVAFFGIVKVEAGPSNVKPVQITAKRIDSMSRQEVEKLLQRLAEKKAPEPKMGAMCYDVALPPERAEYVCPDCGEKTLYTENLARTLQWSLTDLRRQFKILEKEVDMTVALDESEFCQNCSPDAEKPQFALTITYEDGRTHRARPVNAQDLRMLRAFLSGKLELETSNDGTMPLKPSIPRLRELLGLIEEDNGGAGEQQP